MPRPFPVTALCPLRDPRGLLRPCRGGPRFDIRDLRHFLDDSRVQRPARRAAPRQHGPAARRPLAGDRAAPAPTLARRS